VGRAAPAGASRRPSGASCALPAGSEPAIEGGSVRALFEQRLLQGERRRRGICRSWLHTVRSFSTPRSLFDCLVDSRCAASANRGAASTRWRRSTRVLSGSQRNAIVSRTRAQVCYVLDSWLRHNASDFLADSELFADWRSCWCSAPTFADSLAVWYRVSPGETALPFHRKRPAYEAANKEMLKHCGGELDPKSRTLLDDHSVEVARQNGAGGAR
jgi:hypothetical protein